MNLKVQKKGQLGTFSALLTSLAVIAVLLVVTFLIQAEVQDSIVDTDTVNESNTGTWSTGYNASLELQNATADIPGWLPIVVITVIGSALLGLVRLFRS